MRTMKKAFLSSAVVAAAAVLAAAPVMANGSSCPTLGTPTVVSGPCPVVDPTNPVCAGTGGWTGIQYQIPGALTTDYVSTLVTANNTALPTNVAAYPAGYSLQPACTAANGGGDLVTDLGEYSCHQRALRVKVNTDGTFWVLVLGSNKQPIPTSISQKRGYCSPSPPRSWAWGWISPWDASPPAATSTRSRR